MLLRNTLAAISVLLILIGCNTADNARPAGDFVVSIKSFDKFDHESISFVQGEEVKMVLSIKNVSPDTKTLSFSSSKQYDFVIKEKNGAEVWRWSDGKLFTAAFSSYGIAPGETKTFSYKWDQTISDKGELIPIGSYTLAADDIGIDVIPTQNLQII